MVATLKHHSNLSKHVWRDERLKRMIHNKTETIRKILRCFTTSYLYLASSSLEVTDQSLVVFATCS